MTDMTPERLAEIRSRLEAATPGPWDGVTDREEMLTLSPLGYGEAVIIKFTDRFSGQWGVNADLIAHAPTDIADLLAEVERLQRDLALEKMDSAVTRGLSASGYKLAD